MLNTAICVLVVLFMPFGYAANDDTTMACIAKGCMFGAPDSHVVYIHFVLGQLLAWLYGVMGGVEWYTLFMLACQVVAVTVVAERVIETQREGFGLWLSLIAIYLLYINFTQNLTFTKVAGLLATAGVLTILKQGNWWPKVGGALLFLLAALLRFDAAMFTGVATLLLFPFVVSGSGFDLRQFGTLAAIAIMALSLNTINGNYYLRDPKWHDYWVHNSMRAECTDSYSNFRAKTNLPEGITESDYTCLSWYFFYETDRFTNPIMEQLVATINQSASWHGIPHVKRLKLIFVWYCIKSWLPYLAVVALLYVAVAFNCHKRRWIWLAVALVGMVVVCNGVIMVRVLKYRALLALLLPAWFIPLSQVKIKRAIPIMVLAVALLLLQNRPVVLKKPTAIAAVSQFIGSRTPIILYGNTPDAFNIECSDEVSFGWVSRMPGANYVRNFPQLLDPERYIFVCTDTGEEAVDQMCLSLKDHYGIEARYDYLYCDSTIAVFTLAPNNE